jgi:phosphohistidine phosphatase
LAPRGTREAALAGAWIAANAPALDAIVCSTAQRARQTLDAAGLAAGSAAVEYSSSIYEAYPEELQEIVTGAGPLVRTLLLVGHAPGIPDLAEQLAGPGSDQAALDALASKFPTSAVAVVTSDGDWADFADGGRLTGFVVPRS